MGMTTHQISASSVELRQQLYNITIFLLNSKLRAGRKYELWLAELPSFNLTPTKLILHQFEVICSH